MLPDAVHYTSFSVLSFSVKYIFVILPSSWFEIALIVEGKHRWQAPWRHTRFYLEYKYKYLRGNFLILWRQVKMLLFFIISSKEPSTNLHLSEKQLNGVTCELWNIILISNKINLRIDLHWKSMIVLDR